MAETVHREEDYRWLVSEQAAPLLREVAESETPLHQLAESLRRDLSANRVHLLMEQVELRRRGASKFPRADEMFFTRIGLEQATDAWLAQYKAARFQSQARVADLCCGIGGDLLAIGEGKTPARGIDHSEISLCLAEANARALGIDPIDFLQIDAEETPVQEYSAWHIDPDRRPGGTRTTRVDLHAPNAAALDRLQAGNPSSAIKLAPAAELPQHWSAERELEWISRGGECKQLVVWSGSLTDQGGQRRATALSSTGEVLGTVCDNPDDRAPLADDVGESVYEPDAALFAAGLDDGLACDLGLARLSSHAGYLTGPRGVKSLLLTEFIVQEITPLRTKQLKASLAALNAGPLELKQRGVQHDLPSLRKQLKTRGDQPFTVLLTRRGEKRLAIIAQRKETLS